MAIAFNENHIKKYIITFPFIGIVITAIILTTLFISQMKTNHKNDIRQLKIIYQNHAKEIVKDRIDSVLSIIKQKETQLKNSPNNILETAIQSILNELTFKNKGYLFAYDLKGNTIAHIKQSLIGKNRWNHERKGLKVVQDIINKGQKEDGSFMYYTATLNPNKKQSTKKVSYVKKIPNMNWVIGTGIYTDNLDLALKEKENILKLELEKTIKITLLISFILTVIGILIMFLIANSIFNIITRYQRILAMKNETLEERVKERTQEQDNLLSLFNESDTILFKWDCKKHKLIYVSKSIDKIVGYSHEDFLNQTIKYKDCIYADDFSRYKLKYQNAIKDNKEYYEHKPYRIKTKDNQIKWIHDYTVFVRNDKNELTYLIGYLSDITLFKEYDQTIYEQSKMASLGEMLGNISHQWRQPLSTISTAASGLKIHKEMDLLTDDTFFKSINGILKNSNYLSKTINDFSNYIQEGSQNSDFKVREVLEKNLLLLDGNIKTNHINIIKDFQNDLELYGSKRELMQVVMNIINNAIDILKEKEDSLHKLVFISTKEENGKICIDIKDNAGGIPVDNFNKIFDPYFTSKHQSQGTGLGLYMARKIIKDMNGNISVSNKQYTFNDTNYTGAQFNIELPIHSYSI